MVSEISRGAMPTVLVVDDEALIRWSLHERLGKAGFRILEAADGHAAADQLSHAAEPIDLVLLDMKLPDMDGLDVLRIAKERDPGCAVILMSAFGAEDVVKQALADGATDFVPKPFRIDEVLALVRRTLTPAD
jgi:DNA-binding NtrC family response regulator